MTRKLWLFACIFLSLCASNVFAACQTPKNKWYVGADMQDNLVLTDYYSFNNKYHNLFGASVLGGYRWDYVGAELGFSYINKLQAYSPTFSLTSRYYNLYLDGAYYYPLTQRLDLKGIFGVGYLIANAHYNYSFIYGVNGGFFGRYNRVGVRLGAGLQYYINDCVSTNISYKLQSVYGDFNFLNTFALGVSYHF